MKNRLTFLFKNRQILNTKIRKKIEILRFLEWKSLGLGWFLTFENTWRIFSERRLQKTSTYIIGVIGLYSIFYPPKQYFVIENT